MAAVEEATASVDFLLSVPGGWSRVAQNVYADPAQFDPATPARVEAFDYRTLASFNQVVGSVPNMDQRARSFAQANGSMVYGTQLLHTVEFNVVVPTSVEVPSWVPGIGGTSIPVPGGGTTLARVDRYRWVVVHSIAPLIIIAIAVAAVIGAFALAWMVKHWSSPDLGLGGIGPAFTKSFVQIEQGPTQNLVNAFLLTFGISALFSAALYYYAIKHEGPSAISLPDLAAPPAPAPLNLGLAVSQPSYRLGPLQTAASTASVGSAAPPPVVIRDRGPSGGGGNGPPRRLPPPQPRRR